MSIHQKRREPLDRFAAVIGVNEPRGPYTGEGRTPMYRWQVTGKRAHVVAERLRPYLSLPKQEQLDQALQRLKEMNEMKDDSVEA